MSELLVKETIYLYNTSENWRREKTYGLNYQKLGKELMSQGDIAVINGGKCILQAQGVCLFFSDKFETSQHKEYKYLFDNGRKNVFDVEQYLKRFPIRRRRGGRYAPHNQE